MTKQIASKVFALLSGATAAAELPARVGRSERPWTDPASSQFRDIASCL